MLEQDDLKKCWTIEQEDNYKLISDSLAKQPAQKRKSTKLETELQQWITYSIRYAVDLNAKAYILTLVLPRYFEFYRQIHEVQRSHLISSHSDLDKIAKEQQTQIQYVTSEDILMKNAIKLDAHAVNGEAVHIVEKRFYTNTIRKIFGKKFAQFRSHQPRMIGFLDRPKDKTSKDKSSSEHNSDTTTDSLPFTLLSTKLIALATPTLAELRLQQHLHDGDLRPHLHFLVLVPETTPCGIPIRENFEKLIESKELHSLWRAAVGSDEGTLHIQELSHTDAKEIGNVLFYSAETAIADSRNPEKKIDGRDMMILLPAPERPSMYKEWQKRTGNVRKDVRGRVHWQ